MAHLYSSGIFECAIGAQALPTAEFRLRPQPANLVRILAAYKRKQGVGQKSPSPCCFSVVRPAGFEPAAYGFVVRRSIRAELRAHVNIIDICLILKPLKLLCQ
jgi:hypothetical protein